MKGVNIMSRKKAKRRRLPNGFGQISELKGQNLRKPFRAMITVGKNEKGRPICELLKPVAYFETYNDAYAALVEYHKSPREKMSTMTMKELYDKWTKWHFKRVKPKTAQNITAAWEYCHPLYDVKLSDLRISHIRDCIENANRVFEDKTRNATVNTKSDMKQVFNMMLDYAVEYGMIDRNYAREMKINTYTNSNVQSPHIPFTDDELNILWNHSDIPFVKVILINCYSGWRPIEMARMKLVDTNITDWSFKGGVKTDSGKNRIVPIHSLIRPFVKEFYDIASSNECEYLLNIKRKRGNNYNKYADITSYHTYRHYFLDVIGKLRLNPNHRPHDCRKTFVTLAKRDMVDEYAIKRIIGHSISDLTERVYTERNWDWFLQEIEKIKGPVGVA